MTAVSALNIKHHSHVVAMMMTACGTSLSCSMSATLPCWATELSTNSHGGKMWTTKRTCWQYNTWLNFTQSGKKNMLNTSQAVLKCYLFYIFQQFHFLFAVRVHFFFFFLQSRLHEVDQSCHRGDSGVRCSCPFLPWSTDTPAGQCSVFTHSHYSLDQEIGITHSKGTKTAVWSPPLAERGGL